MSCFLILPLVLMLALLGSASTSTAGSPENPGDWESGGFICIGCGYRGWGRAAAASSPIAVGVYKWANYGGGREPGEPNPSNKMSRTVWGKLTRPTASRVVIHTFGSDFDTALAAYTGNALNALTLARFNNDKAVVGLPGPTSKQSLVQFDAAAGIPYSIQIGAATGSEGNISVNVYVFPPGGGISAFLAEFNNNNTWGNRDANCGNAELLVQCSSALFILHNSTNKVLTVTASSKLGAGVAAPAPFQLAAGAVKAVRFTFTAAFNTTTPRTVSGYFTFIGRSNGTEIARTDHPALVVIENNSTGLGNVLRADVQPTVRAGRLNEGRPFEVKLTNVGAQNANGCHARTDTYSQLKTLWQWINPNSGAALAPTNQPIVIPAGQTKWLRVTLASQEARVADPEFPAEVTLDCFNTDRVPINLSNTFDLTAVSLYRPQQVTATKRAPAGDILNVPAAGGIFRVSAKNLGAATQLRALAVYIRPFGEPANKEFKVKICRTATDGGACLQPRSSEVNYTHAKNATAFFKVFVTRPAVNPGFDPEKRRVFFKLWQDQPTTGSFDAVVAAESVAVRRN